MAITATLGARQSLGKYRAVDEYIIRGTDDKAAAISAMLGVAPATSDGLTLVDYDVEWEGPGLFRGNAHYATPEIAQSDTGETTLAFDLSGEQIHRTHSIGGAPIAVYVASGETAPATFGAIGVNGDSIEGVDVISPGMAFEVTYYKSIENVTWSYIQAVHALVGTTNNASVSLTASGISMTFATRELLLVGASAAPRGEKDWEFKLRFVARPNVTGLTIGDITGINKKGHEYLWVRYEDETDDTAKSVVKKAVAAYVEQVYPDGDYSVL